MRFVKENLLQIILILIISILTVLDLFINTGRSANMDGLIHVTTIAQFYDAMKQGEFPVTWSDGFANYGMPVPIFAQQLSSYLGAFINFLTLDPVLSFNIVSIFAVFFSTVFFYFWLRIYFPIWSAFLGAFLFNFAPYRIVNLYIRGAIPETLSTFFLPLILIASYYIIKKKKFWAIPLYILAIAGLGLSHPMMLLISTFIFVPYIIFLLLDEKYKFRTFFFLMGLMILGVGIVGYYYLPLMREVRYFFYGQMKNQIVPNQGMTLRNFFDPNWYYFIEERNDIFNRGHFISAGIIETVGMLIGLIVLTLKLWKSFITKKLRVFKVTIFEFALVMSFVVAFMTMNPAYIIYKNVDILSNIQFPWRMFAAFIFLPPILYAWYSTKLKDNKALIFAFIILVTILRVPQLYGKNYTNYPQSTYFFTPVNLHSNNLNTIWTEETQKYPIKKEKGEIIEGEGKILEKEYKNSSRKYKIDAKTEVRMADYTFYFPGWMVYVDGQPVIIEFQDINYRGVITYKVPPGMHDIRVAFEPTKTRTAGKLLSLVSLLFLGGLVSVGKKPIKKFLDLQS